MADREIVDLDTLTLDPDNANKHPQANLEAISQSLKRYGQQTPIVIDAGGIVIKGNGTVEAARALGWDKIWVTRSQLAGMDARAYAIADNRASELSEWDTGKLGATMDAIRAADPDLLEFVGFTPRQLDSFRDSPPEDWEQEWGGMPEFSSEDMTAHKVIRVHFADEAAVEQFAQLVGQTVNAATKFLWYPKRAKEQYGVIEEEDDGDVEE